MKKLFIACSMLSLFSCTRAEKNGATSITLNVPANLGQQSVSPLGLNSGIIPANLADINCFAALISGPEEKMRDNICQLKGTSTTFPVGMVLGGFPRATGASARLSFEVPNGKDRGVYLIGFKVDATAAVAAGTSFEQVCTQFIKNESLENYISEPYLIATTSGIAMTGEDLTLDMTATLNLSNKIGDCKGPDFPNGGNSSSREPARFGLSFQDDVGITNAKPFSPNKCVGVRFQVQDSSGNRADISTNPNISARVTMNYLGSSIGTFYHAGGLYGCAPGTEISSGSSDMTISFRNGGAAFSDFVAYFSPSSAQSPTGTLLVQNNGSTSSAGDAINMQASSTTFYYSNTTKPPLKYALYDVMSNKSTASSTTLLTRNVIVSNQCRSGALQFMDMYGVPTRLDLSSGPYDPIQIMPVGTSSNLRFYPSSNDCSISSNDTSTATIMVAPSTTYGSYNFHYKTLVPISSFSFSVLNVGTSTSALVSGDMSDSSNFWESVY